MPHRPIRRRSGRDRAKRGLRGPRTALSVGLGMLAVFASVASSAHAGFGIVPGSVTTAAVERDGAIDMQAGSHPYEYTVGFAFDQNAEGEPEGRARDVLVDLPPGLIGDPLAVPACPPTDFEGNFARCPGDTQIGVVDAEVEGLGEVGCLLFNLLAPPGVLARFGFAVDGLEGFEDASLLAGSGYGVQLLLWRTFPRAGSGPSPRRFGACRHRRVTTPNASATTRKRGASSRAARAKSNRDRS